MKNNKNKKRVCINLSMDEYQMLLDKAGRRGLDRTNYIRYIIKSDGDDLYNIKAANALKMISEGVQSLLYLYSEYSEKNNSYEEYCNKIEEGVKMLWRSL